MEIIEYTDAMCSWAWGTEPKLRLLRWRFEDQLDSWRLVMGHLVEDEHLPERDPVEAAPKLEEYWKPVSAITGMPRPAPLHRATSGSRSSGLAVKAAQYLDPTGDTDVRVMRRMRESNFVHGQPPDSAEYALAACRGLDGVDGEAVLAAMADPAVVDAYEADADETRNPNDFVRNLEGDRPGIGRAREARDGRMRFVFPTILVRSSDGSGGDAAGGAGREYTVPGWMPYEDYEAALFEAGAEATDRTRSRPTPDEAFARWPTIAEAELAFLCGDGAAPPAGVETLRYEGGTLYHRTDESLPYKPVSR